MPRLAALSTVVLAFVLIAPTAAFAYTQEIPGQNILIGTSETKYQNWCTQDGSGYSISNWVNPNAIYYRVLMNPDGTEEFIDMFHFYNKFDSNMQYETITQQPGQTDRIERIPDPLNPNKPIYKTKIVMQSAEGCGGQTDSATYNGIIPKTSVTVPDVEGDYRVELREATASAIPTAYPNEEELMDETKYPYNIYRTDYIGLSTDIHISDMAAYDDAALTKPGTFQLKKPTYFAFNIKPNVPASVALYAGATKIADATATFQTRADYEDAIPRDYYTKPTRIPAQALQGSNPFTVDLWFNVQQFESYPGDWLDGSYQTDFNGFLFSTGIPGVNVQYPGTFNIYVKNKKLEVAYLGYYVTYTGYGTPIDNYGWYTLPTDITVNQNEWKHLTTTYSGTDLKLYVNGAEKASLKVNLRIDGNPGREATVLGQGYTTCGSFISGCSGWSYYALKGYVANNVGIFDYAMNTDQILLKHHLDGKDPFTNPQVLSYTPTQKGKQTLTFVTTNLGNITDKDSLDQTINFGAPLFALSTGKSKSPFEPAAGGSGGATGTSSTIPLNGTTAVALLAGIGAIGAGYVLVSGRTKPLKVSFKSVYSAFGLQREQQRADADKWLQGKWEEAKAKYQVELERSRRHEYVGNYDVYLARAALAKLATAKNSADKKKYEAEVTRYLGATGLSTAEAKSVVKDSISFISTALKKTKDQIEKEDIILSKAYSIQNQVRSGQIDKKTAQYQLAVVQSFADKFAPNIASDVARIDPLLDEKDGRQKRATESAVGSLAESLPYAVKEYARESIDNFIKNPLPTLPIVAQIEEIKDTISSIPEKVSDTFKKINFASNTNNDEYERGKTIALGAIATGGAIASLALIPVLAPVAIPLGGAVIATGLLYYYANFSLRAAKLNNDDDQKKFSECEGPPVLWEVGKAVTNQVTDSEMATNAIDKIAEKSTEYVQKNKC